MKPAFCIVDTNVIVSGLISRDSGNPPAAVLDAMLDGRLLYLMSDQLLIEYSSVLRRPRLARIHGLTEVELDQLLTELVANSMWRETAVSESAPDRGDDHLWALLASNPGALLVTGDQLLLDHPPDRAQVVSPRQFVDSFLSVK